MLITQSNITGFLNHLQPSFRISVGYQCFSLCFSSPWVGEPPTDGSFPLVKRLFIECYIPEVRY